MSTRTQTNFAVLQHHDEQLLHLGMLAERYFADDPNTSLLKLRQLTELLAQMLAARTGLYTSSEEKQYDLLRRLQDSRILPREIFQMFNEVRRSGNAASHALSNDHSSALSALKLTWQLGLWFHRTFKDPGYKSGPFFPPTSPIDESAELRAELDRLSQVMSEYQSAHKEAAEQLEITQSQLREAKDERSFWEQLASETELAKSALEQRLVDQQAIATAQPKSTVIQFISAAITAASAVQLDEADTRKIIDQQLLQAGWEADSEKLRYNKGTRPEKNRNRAIAEWPTESGPADYVLLIGLMPVAVIEAKRKNVDVSGALQQAKRYSRTFKPSAET
ncbi:MAG: type I restriction endonuclease, partial [Methylicorpusculum sp.]|nr:type I restriction endonuclease [Methylicorpusculum sp.]